jgi:predicted GIY-YIG superfamily endonuclease
MVSDVQAFYVYLLECADGSLYTGIALDVAKRVDQHNRGKGAKYTRGRGPVRVVAISAAMDKGAALRLEILAKKLPPSEKRAAIAASLTPPQRPRAVRRPSRSAPH